MTRKALIAANWKMYKTPAEAKAFVDAFLPLVAGHTRDEIALFPSPVLLATVIDAAKGSNVAVGCQNIHFAEEGAYTGETSIDRKSTRLNSSHLGISYAVFCLKKNSS